jgi:hypothetical protein
VCLVHPSDDARHALVGLACVGNRVVVRTGDAVGAVGAVLGKRGGGQRVIAVFAPDVLAKLRPGDQVAVTSRGQGATLAIPNVSVLNIDPGALGALGVTLTEEQIEVGVRATFASRAVGNGIGRPMAMWDLDLQLDGAGTPATLRLGDLVAITDLDARWNAGYRRGALSVGVVVHGDSPQPGHGPGVTVILSGPAASFVVREEHEGHRGLSEERLLALAEEGR